MDVLMPEMDGLVAAEAICRRWPRGNRPLLIALTAMAGPGDQERCLRAGFDNYMSKPVRRSEEHTNSSHSQISYAVFCLKKKTQRFPREHLNQARWVSISHSTASSSRLS